MHWFAGGISPINLWMNSMCTMTINQLWKTIDKIVSRLRKPHRSDTPKCRMKWALLRGWRVHNAHATWSGAIQIWCNFHFFFSFIWTFNLIEERHRPRSTVEDWKMKTENWIKRLRVASWPTVEIEFVFGLGEQGQAVGREQIRNIFKLFIFPVWSVRCSFFCYLMANWTPQIYLADICWAHTGPVT